MQTAEIAFSQPHGDFSMSPSMTLSIGGEFVLESSSQETIARELQIRAVRYVTFDGVFTAELPTTQKTLAQASELTFAEPMATLKLIAACAAVGETVGFLFPERRRRPRDVQAESAALDAAAA